MGHRRPTVSEVTSDSKGGWSGAEIVPLVEGLHWYAQEGREILWCKQRWEVNQF